MTNEEKVAIFKPLIIPNENSRRYQYHLFCEGVKAGEKYQEIKDDERIKAAYTEGLADGLEGPPSNKTAVRFINILSKITGEEINTSVAKDIIKHWND